MDNRIRESVFDTLTRESQALLELRDSYDQETLEQVLRAFVNCKGKILVAGCGTSAMAARKIAHTLCCVCCPALFLTPSDAVHGGMGVAAEGDILVLLSKGGMTREINELIAPAKERGATIIGVCENEASQLAQESDIFFKVKTEKEADDFNMLATSSTLSVISIFDAIAIAITRVRGYSKEEFAVIHPHGAVGERLISEKKNRG